MSTDYGNIVVDEALVIEYARVKGVTTDIAREKLKENMIKEASVDLRQQMTTLMNAFRKMAPQLQGVVQREGDYNNGIKQLNLKFSSLEKQFEDLIKRLDFERETYAQAMKLLNGIVAHDEQTLARITALENPWYKRLLNRIKCSLKIN